MGASDTVDPAVARHSLCVWDSFQAGETSRDGDEFSGSLQRPLSFSRVMCGSVGNTLLWKSYHTVVSFCLRSDLSGNWDDIASHKIVVSDHFERNVCFVCIRATALSNAQNPSDFSAIITGPDAFHLGPGRVCSDSCGYFDLDTRAYRNRGAKSAIPLCLFFRSTGASSGFGWCHSDGLFTGTSSQ